MREVTFPNYFFIDDSMDLNSKSVEEKIRQYRVFKSCSQSTLMGLCEVANHPMSQARLCALASGFSGGIGGTFDEGTCGALTGALIALGFLEDDEIKIKMDAKKLYDAFKKEYGSVQCGIISKNGEDKSPCVDCCVYAANEAIKLLKENNALTVLAHPVLIKKFDYQDSNLHFFSLSPTPAPMPTGKPPRGNGRPPVRRQYTGGITH